MIPETGDSLVNGMPKLKPGYFHHVNCSCCSLWPAEFKTREMAEMCANDLGEGWSYTSYASLGYEPKVYHMTFRGKYLPAWVEETYGKTKFS